MDAEISEPTRNKHHRSPSDEENNASENPSKRRKHHRHKHHHRHRRHSRSSKKEGKAELEDMPNEENDHVGGDHKGSILGIDYDDMEEGEILEDDEAGDASPRKKKPDSGLPSDDDDTSVREKRNDLAVDASPSTVDHVPNGQRSKEYDAESRDKRTEILAENERMKYTGMSGSASQEMLNGRAKSRSGMKSPERSRRRSRSRSPSVFREGSLSDPLRGQDDGYHSKNKHRSESDDEIVESSRDNRYSTKYPPRGKEREHSLSRHSTQVDRHHSRETRERDRKGSREPLRDHDDGYRSKRKHRSESDDEIIESSRDNKYSSKDLPRGKEREHSLSRHSTQADRHHSRETRERDREGSRDLDRDRARERSVDKHGLQDLERERERDRNKDRERERDMNKDRERERDMNKERERERQRGWERERERERDNRQRDQERERKRDRDRESSRDRYRSRDEYHSRHSKYNDDGDFSRHDDYRRRRHDTSDRDRARDKDAEKTDSSKADIQERDSEKSRRDENEQEDYLDKVVLQLEEHEEDDLEKIKEESRRRRQAILEKYKNKTLQQQQQQQLQPEQRTENKIAKQPPLTAVFGTIDGRTDGTDDYVADVSFSIGKSPPKNGIAAFEKHSDAAGGLGAGTPKSERSNDMFCDDIFGESPTDVRKTGKRDGRAVEWSGQHDNWDDVEGYYSYRFGEVLDGRYEIIAAHGKGVFSTVVRAKDLKANLGDPEEVAIKIIRNNDTMLKAGMEELVILNKLVGADPENKRHCVRFLSSFKYRNHLCLVFESLHMNLREVLKKFGRNIGLKLTAVRAYAKQLFIALKHLRNCGVLHCDIKPDNMLVNEAKNILKLCDFGNAMFAGKNEVTPYLVSRFYRSPEIILGLSYDHPMDMWSVGCCLYELYTGKVLFPGSTNNDMLRLQMELKGLFPKKMVRKGAFKDQHFDQNLNFLAVEEDPVTKKAVRRTILTVKPKDFGTLILGSPGEDPKMLTNFKDLLEKIFMLDPDKRLTVAQALGHPFITGK